MYCGRLVITYATRGRNQRRIGYSWQLEMTLTLQWYRDAVNRHSWCRPAIQCSSTLLACSIRCTWRSHTV